MPEELDELMATELPPPGGMPANAYVAPTGFQFGRRDLGPTYPAGEPAAPGARAVAAAIDVGIAGVAGVIAWVVLAEVTATTSPCSSTVAGEFVVGSCRKLGYTSPWPWVVAAVVTFAVAVAVVAVLAPRGGTPGARVSRVRVVDAGTGGELTTARATGRIVLALYLSLVTLGVSWLAVLWDAEGRAWHDRILDTAVVED